MDQGIFGLPIKAPGSLYWFNVSLILLVIMSFQAFMTGSFPLYFFLASLAASGVTGIKRPLLDAEALIRNPKFFIAYSFFLFVMSNVMDRILHKPPSFSGTISTVLAFIVGFYLGRYTAIERFSIEPQSNEVESGITV